MKSRIGKTRIEGSAMTLRLGLAQTLSQIEEAAQRGVNLLVFPENFMPSPELAEPLDGPFVRNVCSEARTHKMWIAFTAFETNPDGQPFNTAVVVDEAGAIRGAYRKCHLYDAHGVFESERNAAGDALCKPIPTPFCTLGIAICYDLRFPEVARRLTLNGCNVLIFPAAWHDGPRKLAHWRTLLAARAIENECIVVGACNAGERYVQRSFVFGPLGEELACDKSDELIVCDIDLTTVAAARDAMPVFSHRRQDLY